MARGAWPKDGANAKVAAAAASLRASEEWSRWCSVEPSGPVERWTGRGPRNVLSVMGENVHFPKVDGFILFYELILFGFILFLSF